MNEERPCASKEESILELAEEFDLNASIAEINLSVGSFPQGKGDEEILWC
jgi:aspartate/tyrosine/aromatic aminotransferase